jgi:N-acylneuraminate cytidylyltransferase
MYKDKKILALITARGGSKGIPNKNIKSLGGKPLIVWTIEAALKSAYIDKLILSSESTEIINIAKDNGCEVPFVRPNELAEDDSSSMDVIIHAISKMSDRFDYLLLLQPTSPFRTYEHINKIIEDCIDKHAEMMVSVAIAKSHPLFMYESSDGFLVPLLNFTKQMRRQDMSPIYQHNGALYMATLDIIKSLKSYNIPKAMYFEMHGASNLDIDDISDWEYAEYLISSGKI